MDQHSDLYSIDVKPFPVMGNLRCPSGKVMANEPFEIFLEKIEVKKFNVTWRFKDKVVTPSAKYEISRSRSHGKSTVSLIVNDSVVTDTGTYSVMIRDEINEQHRAIEKCRIEVKDQSQKSIRPHDQEISTGDEITIKCGGPQNIIYQIKFVPKKKEREKVVMTIKKVKQNEPYDMTNKEEIDFTSTTHPKHWELTIDENMTSWLRIRNASLFDAGQYTCEIKNKPAMTSKVEILKRKLIVVQPSDITLSSLKEQWSVCAAKDSKTIEWKFMSNKSNANKSIIDRILERANQDQHFVDDKLESQIKFDVSVQHFAEVMGSYKCIANGDLGDDEAEFHVVPSSNDIKNQLRAINIDNIRINRTTGLLYFEASQCSSYVNHYMIATTNNLGETDTCDMVECNMQGKYNLDLCPGSFSIIPLFDTKVNLRYPTVPEQSKSGLWWTTTGETSFDDIKPASHGLAVGILNHNTLHVPKVSSLMATFDKSTVLRLSWSYSQLNYHIMVVSFNVRLYLEDDISDVNVPFKGNMHYQQVLDLEKLFPLISYGEADYADKQLTIEVRIRESDLGLGTPEIIDVNFGFESYEVIVASGVAFLAVFLIFTGNYLGIV